MRALLAILGLVVVAGAASGAAQGTVWGWQGTDARGGPARIAFERYEGSGPLFLFDTSARVACSDGQTQLLGVALNDKTGIPVHADGTFAYTGPTDGYNTDPRHPTVQLSGRLAGRTITGMFRLAGDVIPAEGEPRCHAESELISFTAHCEGGCPKPKKPSPATVLPGIGIGGPGLGMRGVAKIGMTAAQVRARHRTRPYFSQMLRCRSSGSARCGRLMYRYRNGGRAAYLFNPRLRIIELEGGIRTKAGVADRSTEAQLVSAYPRARCKRASGFLYCYLLRGTATRGVATQFVLGSNHVFAVTLFDCTVYSRTICLKAVRP